MRMDFFTTIGQLLAGFLAIPYTMGAAVLGFLFLPIRLIMDYFHL